MIGAGGGGSTVSGGGAAIEGLNEVAGSDVSASSDEDVAAELSDGVSDSSADVLQPTRTSAQKATAATERVNVRMSTN
ncbi:hypothetical protein [Williamsia limnetica]|uniref:hypothetical protein n=1 Tax=Williamsia limnetica TaxID=882452 RepID=UPI001314849C|nr:hypothetical protein [Williamsia limnetica]